MYSTSTLITALAVFASVIMLAGCENSEEGTNGESDHGHEHASTGIPDSYAAAVDEIKEHVNTVKEAFAAGTPKACDTAIHDVVGLLDKLPEVAAETDMPKEDWEAVKSAGEKLMDAFDKIHAGFHHTGEQGSTYDDVSAEFEEAIAVLEEKMPEADDAEAEAEESNATN